MRSRIEGTLHSAVQRPLEACVIALGCVLCGAACTAPTMPEGYAEALRLERAQRYAEAAVYYRRAAERCRRRRLSVGRLAPKTARRICALPSLREAQMLAHTHRYRAAVNAYLKMERGAGRGLRVGARALARAAELLADRLGQGARSERIWWGIIDRYPGELAADDALRRLIRVFKKRRQVTTLLGHLERKYRRLSREDIADNILFEAAQLYEQQLKQYDSAVTLYLRLTRFHPKSPLRDDAWWHAAALRKRQRRYVEALVIYGKILATREDAMGGASYHSEYLDDAQFQTAMIYLVGRRQPARAAREFAALVKNFPTSLLRDDGQWWLTLALVEAGRYARAKRAFAVLRRVFPRSRFAKEGRALSKWVAFRRAAMGKSVSRACGLLVSLGRQHRRSWFSRRRPKLQPWPLCKGSDRTLEHSDQARAASR